MQIGRQILIAKPNLDWLMDRGYTNMDKEGRKCFL